MAAPGQHTVVTNGSSAWSGEPLASLGLNTGAFVFDYGTDVATFNVGDVSSGGGGPSVPTTTPVPTMPIGFLLVMAGLIVLTALGAVKRALKRKV